LNQLVHSSCIKGIHLYTIYVSFYSILLPLAMSIMTTYIYTHLKEHHTNTVHKI